MKLPTHEQFMAQVDGFLKRRQVDPSRFGRAVMNDPNFVHELRGAWGKPPRQPSLATMDKTLRYIRAN